MNAPSNESGDRRQVIGMPESPDIVVCPPLQLRGGFWIRTGRHGEQDWNVISEVFSGDCYWTRCRGDGGPDGEPLIVVDVGAHVGSFARHWKIKSPQSRIFCVEACRENIPILHKNAGQIATILHAACTYESGDVALLNSVMESGTATGGSAVIPRERIESGETFGNLYWQDSRPLPKITLDRVMEIAGSDRIDVLKLDCEGSEFSIMENGPMERVGFIFGEYHGRERFDELRRRKFADWDFGHMHASADGLGIFHLVNPRGSRI